MHVVRIDFERLRTSPEAVDAIESLLGAWRKNGQIYERAHPIARTRMGFSVFVMIPEATALGPRWSNVYVRSAVEGLAGAGLSKPRVRPIGPEAAGESPDRCKKRRALILFTTYLSVESPVRCGDCFRPVPLYRLPPESSHEYYDIVGWQSDYQSCDSLQMGCGTGARFGTDQLSRLESSLSKRGRAIADRLTEAAGTPTYYYLYRSGGRSLAAEQRRRCPGCGRRWLLPERWHRLFSFKCDRCRLVSNVAWDLHR